MNIEDIKPGDRVLLQVTGLVGTYEAVCVPTPSRQAGRRPTVPRPERRPTRAVHPETGRLYPERAGGRVPMNPITLDLPLAAIDPSIYPLRHSQGASSWDNGVGELAASLGTDGQISPVTVVVKPGLVLQTMTHDWAVYPPTPKSAAWDPVARASCVKAPAFDLVAGHRRLEAARSLNWERLLGHRPLRPARLPRRHPRPRHRRERPARGPHPDRAGRGRGPTETRRGNSGARRLPGHGGATGQPRTPLLRSAALAVPRRLRAHGGQPRDSRGGHARRAARR